MRETKTFKKYHYYVMKKSYQKTSKYIKELLPLEDREVPVSVFDQYEDRTGERRK